MRILSRRLSFLILFELLVSCGTSAQKLTFVQISDAHLFDAGKRRANKLTNANIAERLDTWAAWDWALSYVNYLHKGEQITSPEDKEEKREGKEVSFVVFTGDFGLEKVTRSPLDPNISIIDKQTKIGPPGNDRSECWNFDDAVDAVAKGFRSLLVKRIYLVRGNNDLDNENYWDTERFDDFVVAVKAKLQTYGGTVPEIINLTSQNSMSHREKGYEIVGLDSSSFKNKIHDPNKAPECSFSLPNTTSTKTAETQEQRQNIEKADRTDVFQFNEIERVDNISQKAKQEDITTLIFTHIPDLDDPFSLRPGATSQIIASWNLSYKARKKWNDLISSASVRGVFAGHFHDPHRITYQRPYGWTLTKNEIVLKKTYVVPPLAPKFQIEDTNQQSRGFALVTVTKDNIEWQLYWLNTLPISVGSEPDSGLPVKNGRKESEISCLCIFLAALIIATAIGAFAWLFYQMKRKKNDLHKSRQCY